VDAFAAEEEGEDSLAEEERINSLVGTTTREDISKRIAI